MKQKMRARFIEVLKRVVQGPSLSVHERYPDYQIGEGTYGGLKVMGCGEGTILSVGAYTSFASGVKVFLGCDHRIDWVTTFPFNVLWKSARKIEGHPKSKGDVVIGNDVWIGAEAMIMSGVQVGDGAVVGARAVVSKDVPPYAVMVGNPARLAKYRFDESTIDRLLKIRWWEWEKSRIERALPTLLNQDTEAFILGVETGRF